MKRKGVTRVLSLIPAIGSIIAFLLTENMRNPMVFVDRWTWLMVLIALVQVIVCIFARKGKKKSPMTTRRPRLRRKHGTRTTGKSITQSPRRIIPLRGHFLYIL